MTLHTHRDDPWPWKALVINDDYGIDGTRRTRRPAPWAALIPGEPATYYRTHHAAFLAAHAAMTWKRSKHGTRPLRPGP